MDKKEILKKLNLLLQSIDCKDCPLEDVCDICKDASDERICLMLEDKIKSEGRK